MGPLGQVLGELLASDAEEGFDGALVIRVYSDLVVRSRLNDAVAGEVEADFPPGSGPEGI
jgi:hypothetical protein